ncbi:MAG: LamG domain-containing protein, partial [Akkermansiaceae bacterium]|nr:LamG domain-containing protein [Akkermansiaceae bacterium]
ALLHFALPSRAGVLDLDGSGDWVQLSNADGAIPSGNDPFTVEAWINPTSIPGGGGAGGQITFWGNQSGNQANGFRLRGGAGTRHYFWGNDHDENFGMDIISDTTGPGQDGWHHLAFTFTGSESRWYWNGEQLGNARSGVVGVNVANTNHRIGARLDAEYFHGFIDELRIWNVAR